VRACAYLEARGFPFPLPLVCTQVTQMCITRGSGKRRFIKIKIPVTSASQRLSSTRVLYRGFNIFAEYSRTAFPSVTVSSYRVTRSRSRDLCPCAITDRARSLRDHRAPPFRRLIAAFAFSFREGDLFRSILNDGEGDRVKYRGVSSVAYFQRNNIASDIKRHGQIDISASRPPSHAPVVKRIRE